MSEKKLSAIEELEKEKKDAVTAYTAKVAEGIAKDEDIASLNTLITDINSRIASIKGFAEKKTEIIEAIKKAEDDSALFAALRSYLPATSAPVKVSAKHGSTFTLTSDDVFAAIPTNFVSTSDIFDKLNISEKEDKLKVGTILQALITSGKIMKEGQARGTKYKRI